MGTELSRGVLWESSICYFSSALLWLEIGVGEHDDPLAAIARDSKDQWKSELKHHSPLCFPRDSDKQQERLQYLPSTFIESRIHANIQHPI
jgi:phosphatidylserine/phosphatidylglycerophosphate/cardiolipin synthase-like enzyme